MLHYAALRSIHSHGEANTNMSMPNHPSAVTLPWLRSALDNPNLGGFDWQIIGEEFGFTGIVARLMLHDEQPGNQQPESVIAKFPTGLRETETAYRASQSDRQHFERSAREARFYQEIAIPGIAPHCYFAGIDSEAGIVVMLIEDFPSARPGDVLKGCSPEEVERILTTIAPLHARWWDRTAPVWVPGWGDLIANRQSRLVDQVPRFLQRYSGQLPVDVRRMIENLPGSANRALNELAAAPATLIHADLHLDNVLFMPDRAIILDWQTLSHRPAAIDVVFLLLNSLSPAERRATEDDVLASYHAQLIANGVDSYTLQQLRNDCKLALVWALGGTIGWLASADLDATTGRERALIEAVIADQRLITLLQDWQPLD